MNPLLFLRWPVQLVLHSRPVQLAVFLLEKTVQVTADGLEAVVGRDTVGAPEEGKAKDDQKEGQRVGEKDGQSQPMASEEKGNVPKPGKVSTRTAARRDEGFLIRSARIPVKLLRSLQNFLRSIQTEAPPTAATTSTPPVKGRRRLVARKRLEELGFVNWVFRSALYALTDTLDYLGIKAGQLMYARGTLNVTGDKSVDCSPIKERSALSPGKRKEFEDSEEEDYDEEDEEDEEEEEEEERLGVMEQLNKSYNSAEDEEYRPSQEEEPSTDSEEYAEGQTESEESEQSGEKSTLLPRRTIKSTTGAVKAAKQPCSADGNGSASDNATQPRPPDQDRSKPAAASTTKSPLQGEPKSGPEIGSAVAKGSAGQVKIQAKGKDVNGKHAPSIPKIDPAKNNLPASDGTP